MTALHRPKIAIAILVMVYLLSIVIVYESNVGSNFAMIFGIAFLIIPYLVPLVWLGSFKSLTKYLDPVWVKVALALVSVGYLAVSTSWASTVLNEAFHVPASNFPITLAVITLMYLPTQLIFLVIFGIVLMSLFANVAVFWAIFSSENLKETLKKFCFLIFLIAYAGFLHGSSGVFDKNITHVAKLIAVNLDFDENHQCTNLNNIYVTKVSHVGNGNVIIFNQSRAGSQYFNGLFEFAKCEFWPEN